MNQKVFCIFEEVFPSALVALIVFLERVTDPLYCMTSLKCEDGLNDEFKLKASYEIKMKRSYTMILKKKDIS